MKQSFPVKRKISVIAYQALSLVAAAGGLYLGIGMLITLINQAGGFYNIFSPDYLGGSIFSFFYLIFGVVFVVAFIFLVLKKPYSQMVEFSQEGVTYRKKDIFMSWDKVYYIQVKILGIESYFLITTEKKKLTFLQWLVGLPSKDRIAIECRKELVPVIEEYWHKPIKKIEKYRNRNNNAYIVLTGLVLLITIVSYSLLLIMTLK